MGCLLQVKAVPSSARLSTMSRNGATFCWVFALLCLSACTNRPVPLTAQLRREQGLGPNELRQLQLFVSHEVTLRREAEHHDRQIDDGFLRLRAGKNVDEIIIREATPCVATEVRSDAITVAFDDGSTLVFELPNRRESPSPPFEPLPFEPRFAEPAGGPALSVQPVRASDDAFGAYWLATRAGIAQYRGSPWQVIGDSHRAQLLVRADEQTQVEETRRVIDGRKL